MAESTRQLAVVTGASTGIGYELAKCCAENGFDLVVAANEAKIEQAAAEGLPIYLYGSTQPTLDKLVPALEEMFPALKIAGVEPSKFRASRPGEPEEIAERIKASGARIVFVGLGCPRQEVFTYAMRPLLDMPLLAVGAAFDEHFEQHGGESDEQAAQLGNHVGGQIADHLGRLGQQTIAQPRVQGRAQLVHDGVDHVGRQFDDALLDASGIGDEHQHQPRGREPRRPFVRAGRGENARALNGVRGTQASSWCTQVSDPRFGRVATSGRDEVNI